MTKEKVIIDDVEVSKCQYFIDKWLDEDENGKTIEKETHCCGETSSNRCKEIKDCYYKQLQRLNIIHKNTIEAYTKEIKELKLKIRLLKKNLKEDTNER